MRSSRVCAARRRSRPDRMFDAHRGLVDNPVVALNAKADWLGEMMDAIARAIGEGWSDREIVNRVLEGEYRTAYISGGEYSRRNLVKAVRRRVRRMALAGHREKASERWAQRVILRKASAKRLPTGGPAFVSRFHSRTRKAGPSPLRASG